jgi:hypothetical protein
MDFERKDGLVRGAHVAIPQETAAEFAFLRGVYGWIAGGLALTRRRAVHGVERRCCGRSSATGSSSTLLFGELASCSR